MAGPQQRRSGNLNFDPDRDPIETGEEPMADASEYDIYGYADHAGEAFEGEETTRAGEDREIETPEPVSIGVDLSPGGQEWDDTRHGAGFAQPLEEPQRSAHRSRLPGEPEDDE